MAEITFTPAGTLVFANGDTYSENVYIQQVEVVGGVDGISSVLDGNTFLLQTQNSTPVLVYGGVATENDWADVRYRNRHYYGLTASISGGGAIIVFGTQATSDKTVNQA